MDGSAFVDCAKAEGGFPSQLRGGFRPVRLRQGALIEVTRIPKHAHNLEEDPNQKAGKR